MKTNHLFASHEQLGRDQHLCGTWARSDGHMFWRGATLNMGLLCNEYTGGMQNLTDHCRAANESYPVA